jgi:hypothetical protein
MTAIVIRPTIVLVSPDAESANNTFRLYSPEHREPHVLVMVDDPTRLTATQALELKQFLDHPLMRQALARDHGSSWSNLRIWIDGPNLHLTPAQPGILTLAELKVIRLVLANTTVAFALGEDAAGRVQRGRGEWMLFG